MTWVWLTLAIGLPVLSFCAYQVVASPAVAGVFLAALVRDAAKAALPVIIAAVFERMSPEDEERWRMAQRRNETLPTRWRPHPGEH
jgi:orotate phosphoribosyltransferase